MSCCDDVEHGLFENANGCVATLLFSLMGCSLVGALLSSLTYHNAMRARDAFFGIMSQHAECVTSLHVITSSCDINQLPNSDRCALYVEQIITACMEIDRAKMNMQLFGAAFIFLFIAAAITCYVNYQEPRQLALS